VNSVSNVNLNILNHVLARDMRIKKSEKAGASKEGSASLGADPTISNNASPMRAMQASASQLLKNINEGVAMLQTADHQMSVVERILTLMKEVVEEGTKGQVAGNSGESVKSCIQDLAESVKEILQETKFKGVEIFEVEEPVLIYIGNGFSVDILEGEIVFDFSKMLKDQDIISKQVDQLIEQVRGYRERIKNKEGALSAAMASMTKKMSESLNEDYAVDNLDTAKNAAIQMSKNTVKHASLFVSMHESISASMTLNLLQ